MPFLCKMQLANQFNVVHNTGPMIIIIIKFRVVFIGCSESIILLSGLFLWLKLLYCFPQSSQWTSSKKENVTFGSAHFELTHSWFEHMLHSTAPPTTHTGDWQCSVLNVCPGFLPTTPFNKQGRNVRNSGNTGTVSGSQLFAQLWVHFLQLWPLPWADSYVYQTGPCIKEEIHIEHMSNKNTCSIAGY